MHNVNLGLLYTANAGGLLLLCEHLNAFGGPDTNLATRLQTAYLDFRAWATANKVNCSQPPFKVSTASWFLNTALFILGPVWTQFRVQGLGFIGFRVWGDQSI